MSRKVCYMFLACVLCYSCKHQAAQSDVKVINGVAIKESDYPSVVRLVFNGGNSFCTGTFISRNTLLTAAHCLREKNGVNKLTAESIEVLIPRNEDDISFSKHRPLFVFTHYTDDSIRQMVKGIAHTLNDWTDIGIVVFETDVAPAVANLAAKRPPVNSEVVFVGFGLQDVGSKSTEDKVKGTNKIEYDEKDFMGMLRLSGSVTADKSFIGAGKSTMAPGDSGAAVFFNDAIIGVQSNGIVRDDLSINYIVDINNFQNRLFLRTMADRGFDKQGKMSSGNANAEYPIKTGINIPKEWR